MARVYIAWLDAFVKLIPYDWIQMHNYVTPVIYFFLKVTPYKFLINKVEITVFDTPGLADGTGNEQDYLEKIKEKVTTFDVFIFCTEMNTRRFRNDDIKTVQKLTDAFGSKLWEHAVVALTFANEVQPPPSHKDANPQEFFDERVRVFKKKIQDVVLNVGVPGEAVINVPFVAAGDISEPRLPGIDNWLTAFWIATFKRLNRSARPTFFLASIARFTCVSPSEQEIPRRGRPFRRSLPPRQLPGENQLQNQRQRRSFHDFELVYHDECSDINADNHYVPRSLTRSHSMVEKKTPPETKPKPNRPKNGKSTTNDAPAIAVDEAWAKEIMTEIAKEVGKIVCELIHPGAGRYFSLVFSWAIKIVRRMLQNNVLRETESGSVDDEQGQEEEDGALNALKER